MEKQRNNTPLVSIIAPVYNVERYLSTFVQSVLKQSYENWELLLIDDGSEDKCGPICDEFAQADHRIKAFHKLNGGVSSARNVGLRHMQGDWVMMPDPDDELPYDAIELFLNYATEDVDLVSASYALYKDGVLMVPTKESHEGQYDVAEFISLMGIIPQPRNLDRRCCNKLFRASIIKGNEVFFPEDLYYREDILYNYQYLSRCTHRVQCITQNVYTYFRRSSGAAISLQVNFNPKSTGKFFALAKCYDLLDQMNADSVVKKRMKIEMIKAYNEVVALIKKEPGREEDLRIFNRSARDCFSLLDILKLYARRLRRGLKSRNR